MENGDDGLQIKLIKKRIYFLNPGLPGRLLTGEVSGLRSTWVDDEPRLDGRVGGWVGGWVGGCVGSRVVSILGGAVTGALVVVWIDWTGAVLGSPGRILHRSEVQIQARIVSDSTGSGEQIGVGSTGLSILPSRILVGKHSRMTAETQRN